jgi:hypothetical protein
MALTTLAQMSPSAPPDNNGDRLKQILAYVPTEIVTIYTALSAAIGGLALAQSQKDGILESTSLICAALAPIWVYIGSTQSSTKVPLVSLVWRMFAALMAFAVWAIALGGFSKSDLLGIPPDVLKAFAGALIVVVPIILQTIGSLVDSATTRAPQSV